MGLAQGVQFYDAFPCAFRGEHGNRVVVEYEAVRVVVDQQYPVPEGEVHEPAVEFWRRHGAGRHTRIVGPHHLHPFEVHVLKFVEVGIPSVFLLEGVVEHLRAHHLRGGRIGRIARVRNEHLVTLVYEGQEYGENSFLGAHQGLYLAPGVKFHTVVAGVPSREGLPQLGQADIWLVLVAVREPGRRTERFYGLLWRHPVRRTYAQVYHRIEALRLAFGIKRRYLLVLQGEEIFPDGFRPVCWSDYHNAEGYSPSMLMSSMRGLTAESAC